MDNTQSVLLRSAISAHQAQDLLQAKKLYEQALLEEPHRPEILFNLGSVLIALRQMEQATYCFNEVLKIDPDHVAAHYHLGNCYFSLEKFAEAQSQYEKVLTEYPGHVDALSNLGALLLQQKNYEQAMQCFSAVLTGQPDHLEARNNLGVTLMQLQRHYHAAEHFRYILKSNPDDMSVRYSYATALLDNGEFAEAIKQYQEVLLQKPNHENALSNLGIAYLKAGQSEEAKNIFATVLQHSPHNQEIHYLYHALLGTGAPSVPPNSYIKHLFDHYAKHYEQHVVDVLHYALPEQLVQLLTKHVIPLPDRSWHILDLGCGTGLSGLAVRPMAMHLVGVDLSAKMLALAKDKLIYDDLVEADVVSVLEKCQKDYDLLLAADTFNYIGDFAPLFAACQQALKASGWLLFSVETVENGAGWHLQANARYAHNKNYLEQLAQQHGFEITAIENATLREQKHLPVQGLLCLLHKHA